jgi:hypothetical protein
MDDHGHGSHVAGTIGAAANDGHPHVGVAWNVRLMACKFLDSSGSGYLRQEIACLEFALAKGARIINASYGSSYFSQSEFDATRILRDRGVLFVAAAGNSSRDCDLWPSYPVVLPPPNDDFANRTPIPSSHCPTVITGSNLNATKEADEPVHADRPDGRSVWWAWVAPANGPVRITTAGSGFDTLLASIPVVRWLDSPLSPPTTTPAAETGTAPSGSMRWPAPSTRSRSMAMPRIRGRSCSRSCR